MDPQFSKAQVDMEERLSILPQELIDLITDGTLDAVTFTLQQKLNLTDTQVELLENEVIFVLTLFLPKRTFVENVAESLGVDPSTAQIIADEVDAEIFVLVDDILETVEQARQELNTSLGKVNLEKKLEKREDLSKLAQKLTQPNPERLQNPDMEAVEPLRTMEQDMHKVHGYGAYRAQEEEQTADETKEDDASASNRG